MVVFVGWWGGYNYAWWLGYFFKASATCIPPLKPMSIQILKMLILYLIKVPNSRGARLKASGLRKRWSEFWVCHALSFLRNVNKILLTEFEPLRASLKAMFIYQHCTNRHP